MGQPGIFHGGEIGARTLSGWGPKIPPPPTYTHGMFATRPANEFLGLGSQVETELFWRVTMNTTWQNTNYSLADILSVCLSHCLPVGKFNTL